jgi:hypothetical protein
MVRHLKTLKGLTLKEEKWSPLTEKFLARINHECPISFYQDQILNDQATLFHVVDPQGETVAALILRLDMSPVGKELVIVAAGGECKGRLMTLDVLKTVENLAKEIGCDSMRAHMRRSAVKAGFERAGFVLDEYVMKKAV